MTKKLIILFLSGLLLQSCAFIFYNYRCKLDTEFSIVNKTGDTLVRHQVGQLIYRLSSKEKFYTRYHTSTFDSLYFYGPDYHDFQIKIYETKEQTKVHLNYFGFHGFRNNPPHKQFIKSLSDSLRINFGATQTIIEDINNERKHNKKNGT
jgi:hypothetical protein